MRSLAISLLLLLAACSASGPSFNEANLKSDQATIIVYRQDRFLGFAGYFDVDVNGKPYCKIDNAGFFVVKSNSKTEISSSIWDQPGTSRITINAKPHDIYYVRMEMDGSKQVAGALGGLSGQLIAEGAASTGGPFLFTKVDPEIAKQELKNLKQDCL